MAIQSNPKPKLAIAVAKYHHPGQTFVNRHRDNLFGGSSVMIAERHFRPLPENHNTPVFFLRDHYNQVPDYLQAPFQIMGNNRKYAFARLPFGKHRAALVDCLQHHNVNAILAEFGSQGLLMQDIAVELNLPLFCYFRGRDASQVLDDSKRVRAYRTLFPKLAGIFAVSQFLINNLRAAGLDHPNAHAVPSGTNTTLFKPSTKDPNLALAVGRLVAKKSPETNVRAIVAARETFPNLRLEMVGGGPLFDEIRDLVASLGARDFITLHGEQSSEFIAERLSHASLFVQHSVTDKNGEAEGLPSSIQEAFSAGCAVVSTRHAGIPELVVDGQTGYLSDEHDLAGFTDAIIRAMQNPERLAQMGRNAREIAEDRLDYRKLYAKVEDIITRAVHERALTKQ